MATSYESKGSNEPNRNRRRKGAIDFNRLTSKQRESIERIAQTGGQIAVSQKAAHEAILKAVKATFDDMVADNENEVVVALVFSALCVSATEANAKRIAQHPDCPDDVREEVAERIAADEAKRAERAIRKASKPQEPSPPGEEVVA